MVNRSGGMLPELPFKCPVGWMIVSKKRGITRIERIKKD